MIGQARAKPVSRVQGTLIMLLPGIFWLSALVLGFQGISHFMHGVLSDMVGRVYPSLHLMQDAPEAYSAVVSFSQIMGYLYLWVAGIVPVQVARAYRRMPPSTQELLEKRRLWCMLWPSPFVAIGIFTPMLKGFFSTAPDFPAMNFYGLYLYFLGLNLASTYYQELSISQKFDDLFINPEVRRFLPVVGWFVFFTTILLGISG
jgi:hypothetical protein